MRRSPQGLRAQAIDALRPVWREFAIAYYRWALREIPLTHPDLPAIVMRLRTLLDDRGPAPVRALVRWL